MSSRNSTSVVAFFGEGRDGIAADAEVGLDEPGDFAGAAEHGPDFQARERLEFVEGVRVVRVAGRDDERAVVPLDRQEVLAGDQLQWQVDHRGGVDHLLRQVHEFEAEFVR